MPLLPLHRVTSNAKMQAIAPPLQLKKKSKDQSKTCAAHSDGTSGSTESMSAEHVGTGSAVTSTSKNDKNARARMQNHAAMARPTSALNSSQQAQPASEPAPKPHLSNNCISHLELKAL